MFFYSDTVFNKMHIVKVPIQFDIKKTPKLTDGYILRQQTFEGRCIKKMTIYTNTSNTNKYLVLGTFSLVKGEPHNVTGFIMNEEQRAPGY